MNVQNMRLFDSCGGKSRLLEASTKSNSGDRGIVDVHETEPVRVQGLAKRLVDELQVSRHGKPPGVGNTTGW
jgi:hypothetical protein